jgi:hypothetical protein
LGDAEPLVLRDKWGESGGGQRKRAIHAAKRHDYSLSLPTKVV